MTLVNVKRGRQDVEDSGKNANEVGTVRRQGKGTEKRKSFGEGLSC